MIAFILIIYRDQEEEEKKKILAWQSKMSMKNFLDMQVEEKKKFSEFEKNINSEQARIWNTDAQRFFDQEKEINEKVFFRKLNISKYIG